MPKLCLAIISALLLSMPVYAEQMTITTYYPSPYGVYNTLEISNYLKLDPNDNFSPGTDCPGEEGKMFYSNSGQALYVCSGSPAKWRSTSWLDNAPTGAITLFNNPVVSCPTGWTQVAQGLYIVGGGTVGATNGTALSNLEDRPVGRHNHTGTVAGNTSIDGIHSHTVAGFTRMTDPGGYVQPAPGYGWDWPTQETSYSGGHGHAFSANFTTDNAGLVDRTNAPYIQLLICQKN